MRLYIWVGEDVLPCYRGGIAGAMAASIEGARECVVRAYMDEYEYPDLRRDLALRNLPFLLRDPDVDTDKSLGFTMVGSS